MAWNGERRTAPERRGPLLSRSSRASLVGAALILAGLTGILAVALYLGGDNRSRPQEPVAAMPPAPETGILQPGAGQFEARQGPAPDIQSLASGEYIPKRAVISGREFSLELARDPSDRTKGLSGRKSLGGNAAMLFVFPNEGAHRFWMKGTLIPLDLIYIDAGGTIVSIQTMEPEPGIPDAELTIYQPPVKVWLAMEINGGRARELGIEEGMAVKFE